MAISKIYFSTQINNSICFFLTFRKRVGLPYDGFGIKISASPFTLTLKTSEGVKVIWDGDSYLEVSVPPKYKERMCGLCGRLKTYDVETNKNIYIKERNIKPRITPEL